MLQSLLRVIKILLGHNNVSIKSRLEVILGVLGIIMPLCFGCFSSHDKLMFIHLFSNSKRSHVGLHFTVFTEVWDFIVDWVTKLGPLLFVLGATS